MTAVEQYWESDGSDPYVAGYLEMLATSARVILAGRLELKLDTAQLYNVIRGAKTPVEEKISQDAVNAPEHCSGPKETSV